MALCHVVKAWKPEWRNMNLIVHQESTLNVTELERILVKWWKTFSKTRYAELATHQDSKCIEVGGATNKSAMCKYDEYM